MKNVCALGTKMTSPSCSVTSFTLPVWRSRQLMRITSAFSADAAPLAPFFWRAIVSSLLADDSGDPA